MEPAMIDNSEITAKFWKALKSDRTMFLGLAEGEDGHARPMTAQIEGYEGGPIWFFASSDNSIVQTLGNQSTARASAHFASKGHDVWAAIHGQLSVTADPAMIDRLWNPFVAAWYDGKADPKIRLICLDPENAEIWIDASSIIAGVKMLFGINPKEDYKDKVAKVNL